MSDGQTQPAQPYIDDDGVEWSGGKIAYLGAGLKFECPNGKLLSQATGLAGQTMSYQVLRTPKVTLSLPWPPDTGTAVYAERCLCEDCGGRLVGDSLEAIDAKLAGIQASTKVNIDTYFLRYLESARDLVIREAQLGGYAIHHEPGTATDTFVLAPRRVVVEYSADLNEVARVHSFTAVTEPGEVKNADYPPTIAGALDVLRHFAFSPAN